MKDKTVAILGATGTVGRAACEVAKLMGYDIVAVAANQDIDGLAEIVTKYAVQNAALANEEAATKLSNKLGKNAIVEGGNNAVNKIASNYASTVVASIAGVAGVNSTLAAVRSGKKVLLANKESLILGGELLIDECKKHNSELVPVDSEHSALAELLFFTKDRLDHIEKVWLTASGGPFLNQDDLSEVTPEMALSHPVWNMGAKICVDSATLMNKGLEVIEACYLFDLPATKVEVVIQPQAIIHAIVEFADGSSIAHCGPPDMRSAISRAFAWPKPTTQNFGQLDWRKLGKLDFFPPDTDRFPCLKLAKQAASAGGSIPAVLNAANEVAVNSFLNGNKLPFVDIHNVIEHTR